MYMFFWFFKQLFYILKRLTKHALLLLIVFFIIAFFLFIKPSFALSDLYGNYHGFTANDINSINTLIEQYKGNYDSFICRYLYNTGGDSSLISLFFYNENTTGRLYKTDITSTQYPHSSFRVYSENSSTNSVTYYSFKYSDFSYINEGTRDSISGLETGNITGDKSDFCIYTNRNIYTNNSYNVIAFNGGDISIATPYISTSSNTITNWTLENLTIQCPNCVASSEYGTNLFILEQKYNGLTYELDLKPYMTTINDVLSFVIPRSDLLNGAVIRNGNSVVFKLLYYEYVEGGREIHNYFLNSYLFNLTTTEEENVQQDSTEQLIGDLKNEQKQTTEAVKDLENTITDSTVEDSSIVFPTLDIPDLAHDGLAHIFDAFVLAFCTDTPQDIVVPIPYTNKSFTIPYSYTHDMLANYGSEYLLNLINLFWWYEIAKIIAYDIYDKMDKLQSGDIESVQKSNITANMM